MGDLEPVWITGVGAWSPVGRGVREIAANLVEGRSGVTRVERFDAADYPSRVAGQVDPVPRPEGCDASSFRDTPPLGRLSVWCVEAALRDAGLWSGREDARIGLVLGLGAEWMLVVGGRPLRARRRRGSSTPSQDRETIAGPRRGG